MCHDRLPTAWVLGKQAAQLSLGPKPENREVIDVMLSMRLKPWNLGPLAKSQGPKAGKPAVLMSHSRKRREETLFFPFFFHQDCGQSYGLLY